MKLQTPDTFECEFDGDVLEYDETVEVPEDADVHDFLQWTRVTVEHQLQHAVDGNEGASYEVWSNVDEDNRQVEIGMRLTLGEDLDRTTAAAMLGSELLTQVVAENPEAWREIRDDLDAIAGVDKEEHRLANAEPAQQPEDGGRE